MDEDKKNRNITTVIIAIFIGVPLIIIFIDPAVGSMFLFVGAIAAFRAMRLLVLYKGDSSVRPDKTDKAGKTILVQVVDDFGRDLIPKEVERRMVEARAKAGPRDTVIPVKFKVEQDQNNAKK